MSKDEVRKLRRKRFAISFSRAYEKSEEVRKIVSNEANFTEDEIFRQICKVAQINWMDGTSDRRGRLLHLFGRRIVDSVHNGHKSSNIKISRIKL